MKFTTAAVAGLTASASALAIKRSSATGLDGPFLGLSSHSGNTEVHLRPINAINGVFMLDGKPTTSCPPQIENCPPGNQTVFAYSPSQTQVGLEVEVPGGQFVYINPNGALSFSQAHSASIPEGSVSQGFTYQPPAEEGRVGILDFEGQTAMGKASGFAACPAANLGPPFTVYANYEGIYKECVTIGFTTGPAGTDAPAAWQYD